MPLELLLAWMMIFLRSTGILLLLPTVGARPIPMTARVGFCAVLATLLYQIVPHQLEGASSLFPLIVAAMSELVLGLVMGFIARLVFYAVDMAGRLITQQIGLSAAPGIDAPTAASEPLAALISSFAVLIFFLVGGHLGMLAAFARSFEMAPAGLPGYNNLALERIILFTGQVLELGFRMAAPFVAMDFLITLAFSVLGRAVPRMNVFVMSYPVKMIVGCLLLLSAGALFVRYLDPEFASVPIRMLQMVGPVHP